MRSSTRTVITAIALVAALALSGCASASTTPSATVSAQLEQTVLALTQAVAADDWVSADRDLDVLEAQVETALAAGQLSEERAADIRAAIALVRADVTTGIENATPSESPTPTETPDKDDDDKDDDDEEESEKPGNREGNRDKDDD